MGNGPFQTRSGPLDNMRAFAHTIAHMASSKKNRVLEKVEELARRFKLAETTICGRVFKDSKKWGRLKKRGSRDASELAKLECFELEFERERWGFDVTRLEARVLEILDANAPLMVSHQAIYNAMYYGDADADDLPELRTVAVIVSELRKKLPATVGTISTETRQGYRFKPAEVEVE